MKRLFFAAVFFCAPVYGQLPIVEISGPEVGNVGQTLILDASETQADHFSWVAVPSQVNDISTIEVIEEGKRCIVCSVPGTYKIILAASTTDGVVQKIHTLEVVWGNLKPDNTKPQPIIPDKTKPLPFEEKLGLVSKVRDWAKQVRGASRQLNLSLAFKTAAEQATQISDLEKTNPNSPPNLSAELVREAIGTELGAWNEFLESLGYEFAELKAAGKFKTLADYKQAWFEVSEGLR